MDAIVEGIVTAIIATVALGAGLWLLYARGQVPDGPRVLPVSMGSLGEQARLYSAARLTAAQRPLAELIVAESARANLDPRLMLALAVTESSLDPAAVGDDGVSLGLFQLQLPTARDFRPGVSRAELFDAAMNTAIAMAFMAFLKKHWPARPYGAYAEAWTLGGRGKFELGRANPLKLAQMERAVRDLELDLDLNEVWR